ncbi:hypothetical protein TNIN_204561 [Trichonephila inaurata madagascariensis]|uniref:Uncharacterized protein n=1 Tax=Trichonephila inaurata madagascariensis TaxID=2747483 RepID=A0A8X7BQZ7_9ARAC|nr:hypothetical protein TNIN_204561 [Trichonephila inaurata madagascariensis]
MSLMQSDSGVLGFEVSEQFEIEDNDLKDLKRDALEGNQDFLEITDQQTVPPGQEATQNAWPRHQLLDLYYKERPAE